MLAFSLQFIGLQSIVHWTPQTVNEKAGEKAGESLHKWVWEIKRLSKSQPCLGGLSLKCATLRMCWKGKYFENPPEKNMVWAYFILNFRKAACNNGESLHACYFDKHSLGNVCLMNWYDLSIWSIGRKDSVKGLYTLCRSTIHNRGGERSNQYRCSSVD